MSVARRYLALLIVLLCLLPLFFIDVGSVRVIRSELLLFGHIGFFAALAYVATRILRETPIGLGWQVGAVMLAALALGAAIELLQPLYDRSLNLRDIWQNQLGAAFGLVLAHPERLLRARWTLPLLALLTVEAYRPAMVLWSERVAAARFPLLSDFAHHLDRQRWNKGLVVTGVARSGDRSLQVELLPGEPWPGTRLLRGLGDWSGYDHFHVSVFNPDTESIRLTVAIRDQEHHGRGNRYGDRFNGHYTLQPGWNDLTIPVAEIIAAPRERLLDVARLESVMLYTPKVDARRLLYVDAVYLGQKTEGRREAPDRG